MSTSVSSGYLRALAALLVVEIAVLALKGFALAVSALRFESPVRALDVLVAPAADALVVLALLAGVELGRRAPAPLGALVHGLVVAASALLVPFYLACGYVFWEWGAFLERHELLAARMGGATEEIWDYLLDARALWLVVLFAVLAAAGAGIARGLAQEELRRRTVRGFAALLLLLALGSFRPLVSRYAFDPAVPSPLLLCLLPAPEHSGGLDPQRWRLSSADFRIPEPRPVPAERSALEGAAADMDVVVVVLESVRQANVSLYGYARDTMPELSALAEHGLVLHALRATQPRSCKAVESLVLGIYPDPRLECLTWQPERMAGSENLLSELAGHGYALYYGSTAPREVDRTCSFLDALTGGGMDRLVGAEDLGPAARPAGTNGDDSVLVRDFLAWVAEVPRPALALLWLEAAHAPYRALHRPYAEARLVDQYDNCLRSADVALGELARGLCALGREERTLLVVLGDHGEMLGEHSDAIHGRFLYEQSVRIPGLLVNPGVFPARIDLDAACQVKDVPRTLLYLLGLDRPFGQSENVLAKSADDPIYLCNVYQDYKLGLVRGTEKFVLRPDRNLAYLFDLAADPAEKRDLSRDAAPGRIAELRREVLQWYWWQVDEVERRFPRRTTGSTDDGR
jgi:glucan phosphoethanolaminetransferase (alkaline phosphatase superfamily)